MDTFGKYYTEDKIDSILKHLRLVVDDVEYIEHKNYYEFVFNHKTGITIRKVDLLMYHYLYITACVFKRYAETTVKGINGLEMEIKDYETLGTGK